MDHAKAIANLITTINHQFAQTYSRMKSIKEFDDKGCQAAYENMKQLHNDIVFKPIAIKKISIIKKRRAMERLIFLTKKKNGKSKARTCTNDSTQCEHIDQNKLQVQLQ
jgi:hypothetical protein